MKFSKKMRSKRQKEYGMEEEVGLIMSRKTSSEEDSKDWTEPCYSVAVQHLNTDRGWACSNEQAY